MSEKKPSRGFKGEWIVIIVAALALAMVGWSWVTYHDHNPTSTSATMQPADGGWTVRAMFAENQRSRLKVGTVAVITSPALPDQKMSGIIQRVEPGGWCLITLTSPPKDETPLAEMPCVVTVDAATAPVTP